MTVILLNEPSRSKRFRGAEGAGRGAEPIVVGIKWGAVAQRLKNL